MVIENPYSLRPLTYYANENISIVDQVIYETNRVGKVKLNRIISSTSTGIKMDLLDLCLTYISPFKPHLLMKAIFELGATCLKSVGSN